MLTIPMIKSEGRSEFDIAGVCWSQVLWGAWIRWIFEHLDPNRNRMEATGLRNRGYWDIDPILHSNVTKWNPAQILLCLSPGHLWQWKPLPCNAASNLDVSISISTLLSIPYRYYYPSTEIQPSPYFFLLIEIYWFIRSRCWETPS